MRAKVSRVLSLSCKIAVSGITTKDAIMMLIDVIPPRLSRFFAGQGELLLRYVNNLQLLYVNLLKTETQVICCRKHLPLCVLDRALV